MSTLQSWTAGKRRGSLFKRQDVCRASGAARSKSPRKQRYAAAVLAHPRLQEVAFTFEGVAAP